MDHPYSHHAATRGVLPSDNFNEKAFAMNAFLAMAPRPVYGTGSSNLFSENDKIERLCTIGFEFIIPALFIAAIVTTLLLLSRADRKFIEREAKAKAERKKAFEKEHGIL